MSALLRLFRPSASAPPLARSPAAAPGRHKLHEDAQALLTGTLFVALGVVLFGHVGLLTGGTAGLAFLVHYATGWSFSAVFFLINLPFYALAWRRMGARFTVKTFVAVGLLSLLAHLVAAADAVSGARPGARRESLEQYIQRVRALEDLANSFKGVSQSFALQAGREVRIFVKPEEIDDLDSIRLARDIAKNIEETMRYPGQIKVTVIRETRSIDYAK